MCKLLGTIELGSQSTSTSTPPPLATRHGQATRERRHVEATPSTARTIHRERHTFSVEAVIPHTIQRVE